tara:strand:+ start:309 stop:968 length:660 start_codon:yes stop_codon:yes gene_type:complete
MQKENIMNRKCRTPLIEAKLSKNNKMKGIVIKGSSPTKREIVPSGTHIARCYSMIHIGTIEWEYQGEKKFSNKVRLTFELPNELRDFGGDKEQPMVISKEYTLSLHEKSNLRKDFESWNGAGMTTQDLKSFDITQLLGKPAMISIIHKLSKGGNEFAQIGNLNSMTKGVDCPDQINPNFIFNYESAFDEDWIEGQPSWIQEQIKSTDEYQNKLNQAKFI